MSSALSTVSAATGGPGLGGVPSSQQLSSTAQLLAMGDATGLLRIIELPRNLRRPVPNERKLMATFLEKETERVSDMISRGPNRSKAIKAAEEKKKAQVRLSLSILSAIDSNSKLFCRRKPSRLLREMLRSRTNLPLLLWCLLLQ
jgi:hypothetical protein